MKAKDAIPAIAEVTGFPEASLKVADRALADAGMRAKGRGPTPPDLNRQDMIRLLLAVMGAPILSRANEYIADVNRFRLLVHGITRKGGDVANLTKCIGLSADELAEKPLVDVLAIITEHLKGMGGESAQVRLHVAANSYVIIEVVSGDFTGEIQFTGALDFHPGFVRRYAEADNNMLCWIAENSELDA